jgi:cytochrome c oxidase subunit 2
LDRPGVLPLLAVLSLAGCSGRQSSLAPASLEATQLSTLFWWMTGGALVIWLAVLTLALIAIRMQPIRGEGAGGWMIIGAGAVFPTLVLGGLLTYGLSILPGLVAPAPAGSLKISVSGEQWWWRVRYPPRDGQTVELANEIRLPVGEPVQFELASSNVIHAFWIPSLGGKRDMIPGRVTRLALTPTRTGIFRGVCAEYCGTSHALMAFDVVVMERADFQRWWEAEARDAEAPAQAVAARGQSLFVANGCGACHTVRSTSARGVIGPDLTHIGSRLSLGAGTLPNTLTNAHRWIARVKQIKPGALMPPFSMLPDGDLHALAAYLEGLK